MKMSDLVSWNPKYEKKLERKITEEALNTEIVPKAEKAHPMAPQVRSTIHLRFEILKLSSTLSRFF